MESNDVDPLDVLEYSPETAKRATHEALDLTPREGFVEVRNESHADEDEHTYEVHLERGIPFDCTCPADEYHPGACKHRVAVALARPVIDAASVERGDERAAIAVADGGVIDAGDERAAIAVADGGVIDAGDEGKILDDDPLPPITEHRESYEQGGALYYRCEGCGMETIYGREKILHRDDCPRAE